MALPAVRAVLLLGLFYSHSCLSAALSVPRSAAEYYVPPQNTSSSSTPVPTALNGTAYANATSAQIQQAEQLLSSAIAQQGVYNAYRVANPRRNQYTHAPPPAATATAAAKRDSDPDVPQPPDLNTALLAAAALIAERDAALQLANGTLRANDSMPDTTENDKRSADVGDASSASSSSYWLPLMSNNGLPPMGWNASYPVYRDVTAYGAKGDGVTDDTNAINNAIAAGGNCGPNCLSSSVKGTLIYFPPGTYLISSPINAYYYSQLVGNFNSPPTIKTSSSFVGLGAIQTDVYYPNGNGNEWYVEQSVFFRQVRNFIIDITGTTTANVAGLHWQVAQATSLTNVVIYASNATGSGNTQMGMFTENGSGGFMSDVYISGGAYGIYGGNQQYTVRDFTITGQTTACICLIWDWGWTWTGMTLSNAPTGISLINPQDPNGQVAGSTYFLDSTFTNLQTGIYADFNKTILDSSIITLDNIQVNSVGNMISYSNNATLEVPPGNIQFIVVGDIEDEGQAYGSYTYTSPARNSGLTTGGKIVQNTYYVRSRPQYATLATSSIISVKSMGAVGNGVHDDTAAIQSAFSKATTSNLIYFPAGSYIITSTLVVPPNIRMTGSVWSQLVASGSYFANEASPKVMLQVGKPGDVGTVEISDMLFTSTGPLPGLVLVEWNVKASSQGSVGMWDAHFRLGGAYGTQMQVSQCPLKGGLPSGCVAANMMFHVTANANGYFENVWAWVADHDIDDPNNAQVAVAGARGMLIESSGPTWLYGSASEHSMLYQYNFANSQNTFAGMIQTESPYFQATQSGESPGPFNSTIGQFTGDPNFNDTTCNATALMCDFSWALMAQNSTNLTIAGAGLYSWFGNYIQSCVDTQNCQQRIVYDGGNNGGLSLWNLITIGSVEMVSAPALGVAILAKNYTQSLGHPYWSALAGYLDSSEQIILSCLDNDTRPECVDYSTCDLTQQYTTWDALNNAEGSIPNECVDNLALDTLGSVLNASLNNYTVANNGYDQVYGYYQQYMSELIPEIIANAMAQSNPDMIDGGPGNQFFQCTIEGYGAVSTQTCPFRYTQLQGAQSFTMTYNLVNSSGFYNLMQTQYGVNQSWITLGTQTIGSNGAHTGCTGAGKRTDCIVYHQKYVNIPMAASNIQITNPKDIVTAALPSAGELQNNIMATQIDMDTGGWNSSTDDPLQAYSMPVFFLDQSVQSMATAKALGKQQKKEDKIRLILEILGGVFAILPFLDELAPALEIVDGLATAAAEIGNTALTIQSIVADPSSAPMDILGLLLGAGGKDEDEVGDIAAARRELSDTDLEDIGTNFKAEDDDFQGAIAEKCEI